MVDEVLSKLHGYVLRPITEELAALARSGVLHADGLERLLATAVRGAYLRTLPGVHGCDGFFAAVIARA